MEIIWIKFSDDVKDKSGTSLLVTEIRLLKKYIKVGGFVVKDKGLSKEEKEIKNTLLSRGYIFESKNAIEKKDDSELELPIPFTKSWITDLGRFVIKRYDKSKTKNQ